MGIDLGAGLTERYGNFFDSVELINEPSMKVKISGKDGRKPEDYDPAKLLSMLSFLKGQFDGIRQVNKDIRIMLNSEWIRYGFIDAAQNFGIDYDILSWHWYVGNPNQDQQWKSYKWTNGMEIEDWLQNRYPTKEIVFNEVGYQTPATGTFDEDKQLEQVPPLINRLLSKGFSVLNYELFDEPQKGDQVQRNFGLFKSDGTPKKIVEALKSIKL